MMAENGTYHMVGPQDELRIILADAEGNTLVVQVDELLATKERLERFACDLACLLSESLDENERLKKDVVKMETWGY